MTDQLVCPACGEANNVDARIDEWTPVMTGFDFPLCTVSRLVEAETQLRCRNCGHEALAAEFSADEKEKETEW